MSSAEIDLTVSICTHNGADAVPEVLDHLRAQEGIGDVRWDVLVVDNNSTDGTAGVVRQYRETWDRSAALRIVTEQQQGLAFARQRAVDEARGKLVAFLDDDNLPAPDWVAEVVSFAEEHPNAGAFGGQLIGEYEVEPPRSFGLVKGLFAINDCEETFSYSKMGTGEFAPGAGLVVRKDAWQRHVPHKLDSTGISGESRAGGGADLEAQWHLHEAGYEVWHNADMVAKHKMPASRFRPEYLKRFFEGIGKSRHRTRMMRFEPWQRPLAIPIFWLNDLRKLVRLYWQYRHKPGDRFVWGKAQMLKTMLIRPFFGGVMYG